MTQFDTSFGDKIADITGPRQTVFSDQALTHAVHTYMDDARERCHRHSRFIAHYAQTFPA